MTLPGQMELATVIDHKKVWPPVVDQPVAWTWEGALAQLNGYCPDGVAVYGHESPGSPLPLYIGQQDASKPAGVRLAKMLRQYDDSPSSQLWGDIQSVAADILR